MQDEKSFTKAKAYNVPEPGPITTSSERLIASLEPGEIARQNMKNLRRS